MEHLPLLGHQRVRCRSYLELEVWVSNRSLEDRFVHERREVDRSGSLSSVGHCDEFILLLRSVQLIEQIRSVIGVFGPHIFVVDAPLILVEILAVAGVSVDELVHILLGKVGCDHACCDVTPVAHYRLFIKHDLLHSVVVVRVENAAWSADCDESSTGEVAHDSDADWAKKLEKP